MSANVNVAYGHVRDTATKLTKAHQDITQQLQALKQQVDTLVNTDYVTDRSSKAFESSYTEFNRGVTQTIQGLEGMAKFLHKTVDTFEQADSSLASGMPH